MMPTLSHFAIRRRMRLSAIRCSRKRSIHEWPDIRIKHPVHSFPENADVKSVQRIVLTASRSEPVGKTDEVLLVDGFQNCRNRLLDDLVLDTQDGERPLRSIRLRDVGPSGRAGAVAAFV